MSSTSPCPSRAASTNLPALPPPPDLPSTPPVPAAPPAPSPAAAVVSIRARCVELGQTTAEYALVLLGAAAIALLLVAWATGSGKVGELFDAVFGHLVSQAR